MWWGRASSFSSDGFAGNGGAGGEYRLSQFFEEGAPVKEEVLLEAGDEWRRERMFSSDLVHEERH